jgi:hypothetical protein
VYNLLRIDEAVFINAAAASAAQVPAVSMAGLITIAAVLAAVAMLKLRS